MDFATGAPGWIVLDTVCSTILAVEDGFRVFPNLEFLFWRRWVEISIPLGGCSNIRVLLLLLLLLLLQCMISK